MKRPAATASILASLTDQLNPFVPHLMHSLPIILPIMDCPACLYSHPSWRDVGHCYMFRDKPTGTHCAKFTPAPRKPDESSLQAVR